MAQIVDRTTSKSITDGAQAIIRGFIQDRKIASEDRRLTELREELARVTSDIHNQERSIDASRAAKADIEKEVSEIVDALNGANPEADAESAIKNFANVLIQNGFATIPDEDEIAQSVPEKKATRTPRKRTKKAEEVENTPEADANSTLTEENTEVPPVVVSETENTVEVSTPSQVTGEGQPDDVKEQERPTIITVEDPPENLPNGYMTRQLDHENYLEVTKPTEPDDVFPGDIVSGDGEEEVSSEIPFDVETGKDVDTEKADVVTSPFARRVIRRG